MTFMLLFFVPGCYALYLAFMPRWRRAPMSLRRRPIARCLSLSLLTLALLPLHETLEGSPNVVFLLLILLGGVFILHVWQGAVQRKPAEEEELFP